MLLQVVSPAAGAMTRCLGPLIGGGVRPGDLVSSGCSTSTRLRWSSALAVLPWRSASSASLRNFCALEKLADSLSAVEQPTKVAHPERTSKRISHEATRR